MSAHNTDFPIIRGILFTVSLPLSRNANVSSQIPCYIVNLASDTERRSSMEAMLAQHGLSATFFTAVDGRGRSEEHTSELQSRENLVCRLLLEKKNTRDRQIAINVDTVLNVTTAFTQHNE